MGDVEKLRIELDPGWAWEQGRFFLLRTQVWGSEGEEKSSADLGMFSTNVSCSPKQKQVSKFLNLLAIRVYNLFYSK